MGCWMEEVERVREHLPPLFSSPLPSSDFLILLSLLYSQIQGGHAGHLYKGFCSVDSGSQNPGAFSGAGRLFLPIQVPIYVKMPHFQVRNRNSVTVREQHGTKNGSFWSLRRPQSSMNLWTHTSLTMQVYTRTPHTVTM